MVQRALPSAQKPSKQAHDPEIFAIPAEDLREDKKIFPVPSQLGLPAMLARIRQRDGRGGWWQNGRAGTPGTRGPEGGGGGGEARTEKIRDVRETGPSTPTQRKWSLCTQQHTHTHTPSCAAALLEIPPQPPAGRAALLHLALG
eukprot:scaffold13651_cov149-Isochrysis_galbana.AAC.1